MPAPSSCSIRRQTHAESRKKVKRFTLGFAAVRAEIEPFCHFKGVFDGHPNPPLPPFGSLVIEDPEQVVAPPDRGHGLPPRASSRLALERCAQNRRRFLLAFHRQQ